MEIYPSQINSMAALQYWFGKEKLKNVFRSILTYLAAEIKFQIIV